MSKGSNDKLIAKTVVELKSHADDIRRQLLDLRMKKISAPEKDVSLARKLKKNLARTLTFLNQKERNNG